MFLLKNHLFYCMAAKTRFFNLMQFSDRFWSKFLHFGVPFWMQNDPKIDPESDLKTIMFSNTFFDGFWPLFDSQKGDVFTPWTPPCGSFFAPLAPLSLLRPPSWPFWAHLDHFETIWEPNWLILGVVLGPFWSIWRRSLDYFLNHVEDFGLQIQARVLGTVAEMARMRSWIRAVPWGRPRRVLDHV